MGTRERKQPLMLITTLNQLELLEKRFGEVTLTFTSTSWKASVQTDRGREVRAADDLPDAVQELYLALEDQLDTTSGDG